MINQIFDQDSFKVISLFCLSPGSRFRREEIKQKTRLNNVPLDKSLARLLTSGILKREGKLYAINFENDYSKQIIALLTKQHKSLKELPFDVYLLLIELVDYLSAMKGIEVYLFGSYSKLIYSEKSDVDIAILTQEEAGKKNIQKIIQKLEEIYNKQIEPHYFDKRLFYKNKKDTLVREIIKNGIRLI